jgi:ribosomal protein L14E/L6E/L27E
LQDKKRREINQKLQEKLDLEKKAMAEKTEARKLEKERMEQMKRQEEERILAEKKVRLIYK